MSDKPVIVIDNVNAQLLTEQIAHLKIISAKEQNNLVRVESNPLAPNAATEITNFPTETVVRVNNTILAPNAASESTLKSISDKILDKVEVKGMIDVKSSVLPSNAASESTL